MVLYPHVIYDLRLGSETTDSTSLVTRIRFDVYTVSFMLIFFVNCLTGWFSILNTKHWCTTNRRVALFN